MLKKIISILFLFSTLFMLSFSAGNNENFTNLHLDSNGWCPGLEIEFKLYNETDWNNKENIEDALCETDENPTDDNCLEFHPISNAKVIIYNGPLKGLKEIFNGETDVNGSFKLKFDSPNQYLIDIIPNGNYNDLETKFLVNECIFAKEVIAQIEEEPVIILNQTYNQSFSYSIGRLILENTKSNSSDEFELKLIDLKLNEIDELNNTIKSFEIIGVEDFKKLNVEIAINKEDNLKVFKYNTNFKKWNEVSNFNIISSNLNLLNTQLGIYSIIYEEPVEVKIPVVEEFYTPPVESSGSNTLMYIIIVIVILLALVGFFYINSNKNKENYHDSKINNTKNTKKELVGTPKILTSYTDVYSKTKSYVAQYKTSFSKDQIYRALKQNNIPTDIIDKIFLEEY